MIHEHYLPDVVEPVMEISRTKRGLITKIGDMEVPVYEASFYFKICQPGSLKHHAHLTTEDIGKYFIRGIEEINGKRAVYDHIDAIPIGLVSWGRTLYPPYKGTSAESTRAICYSYTGEFPAEHIQDKKSDICVKNPRSEFAQTICEYADWSNGKPSCKERVVVAYLELTTGKNLVVFSEYTGMSIPMFRSFRKNAVKARTIASVMDQDIESFVVRISTEKIENDDNYKSSLKYVEAQELNPSRYFPLVKHYQDNAMPEYSQRQIIRLSAKRSYADNNEDGDVIEVTSTGEKVSF